MSIPLLFFEWLLLKLIVNAKLTPSAQFVLWVFSTPSLLILIIAGIELYKHEFDVEQFFYAIPAMLSICIVILIQADKFYEMLVEESNEKPHQLETTSLD